MKSKKILIDIFVITSFLVLFVIWDQNVLNKSLPTTTAPSTKNMRIDLITTDNQEEFWKYISEGASDMAAISGVTYAWMYPDERNPEKQIQVMKKAIERGASALLVVADDPKKLSGVVEDAKAKGIYVVYVDSPANEEAITTLATNNHEAGYEAGEKMIEYLDKTGAKKGSIGIVNLRGKLTTNQREEGFREALSKDARFDVLPSINVAAPAVTAQEAAEKLISQNNDLVGLFGTNEGTSEGVGSANKKYNNKYVAIGFDTSSITRKLLDEGSLNVIIEQNPYTMGYVGMAEAIAAVMGKKTGPAYFNTGYNILEEDE